MANDPKLILHQSKYQDFPIYLFHHYTTEIKNDILSYRQIQSTHNFADSKQDLFSWENSAWRETGIHPL